MVLLCMSTDNNTTVSNELGRGIVFDISSAVKNNSKLQFSAHATEQSCTAHAYDASRTTPTEKNVYTIKNNINEDNGNNSTPTAHTALRDNTHR